MFAFNNESVNKNLQTIRHVFKPNYHTINERHSLMKFLCKYKIYLYICRVVLFCRA
jgi:hypothetical protein